MRGPNSLPLTIVATIAAIILVACAAAEPVKFDGTVEARVAPLASGATPSIARQQWEEGGRVFMVGKLTVVTPADCGEARARRLMANVRFILNAFEKDYCPMVEGYTVFITDKRVFQMDKDFQFEILMPVGHPNIPRVRRINIIGVCCLTPKEIAVVAGTLDCLPALYHEFCHAALDPDGDHRHPHWKRFDGRGDELSEILKKKWY